MIRDYEGDPRSWGGGGGVKALPHDLVPRDTGRCKLKGSEDSSHKPVTGLGGHGVGLAPPKGLFLIYKCSHLLMTSRTNPHY